MGKERKSRKESNTTEAEAEAAMSLRAILFVCIGARGGGEGRSVIAFFHPRKKGGLRKKRREMSYISG